MDVDLDYIIPALREHAVPIDSVKPDVDNPRVHSTDNIADIRGSLQEFGQHQPIIVNKNTNVIIAGHGRVEAAKSMGWDFIAAVFVDEDEAQSAARAIADNATGDTSEWSMPDLSKMFGKIATPESGELRHLFDSLQYQIETGADPKEAKDKTSSDTGDMAKKVEIINAMELKPHEHYDYVVVLARSTHEWNVLVDRLGLAKVDATAGKSKLGIGRAVAASKLLELLGGDD